jgi:type IV secretory pathway VirD2 relaxase
MLSKNKPIRHAIELRPTHIRCTQPKYRRSNLRARGNGNYTPGGIHFLMARNNQRCVVKISYAKNTKTRSWAAHGEYLQRDHAQILGEKGLGFNTENNAIDIKSLLRQWQKEKDPHVFKLIISPEHGHKLDLKKHAKDLMQHVQKDLKTKVEWVAIDHHNTDYPHLHLLIRGRDDHGKGLVIDRSYLAYGFRHHSQELATRVLGRRLSREASLLHERKIERGYVTEIDRNILRKAENSMISYHKPVSDNLHSRDQRLLEIKRLKFLENIGLAEKIDNKAWKLNANLEFALQQRQLSNDIIESRARHNIRTVTYEMPTPTEIQEHQPLTGKVVGMGLQNELKDQRYLLLEGIDGKVHYLEATNSIVKARDNFEFNKGDIITLDKKKFVNEKGISIEYIKIQNLRSLDELQRMPRSRFDQDVIEFVKANKLPPLNNFPELSFAHEYANFMKKRFYELEKEKIFTKENEHFRLAPDWNKKLERIIRQRESDLKERGNIHKHEQSNKYIPKKQHQCTLSNKKGRSRD